MASRTDELIPSPRPRGLKYLDHLLPLLSRLHDVGCQRDHAGQRQLYIDQYCVLVLLFLFNPILRSFRAIQQASQLEHVQRKLGCPRVSLGAFSEAVEVFEPQRLEAIIDELFDELPPPSRPVGNSQVRQRLTAVDGSVVQTLATLAQAAYLRDKNGQTHRGWRFHTHFDVERRLPTRITVTTARNGGKSDEKQVLKQMLEPDHCYVMDRWYVEFALWNQIVAAGGSYVCRIRDNSDLDHVVAERPVTAADRAGVLRDIVVELGTTSQPAARLDHRARVVWIQAKPHVKTGGRKGGTAGPSSDGVLRIATRIFVP